jgi:hypothetical protein
MQFLPTSHSECSFHQSVTRHPVSTKQSLGMQFLPTSHSASCFYQPVTREAVSTNQSLMYTRCFDRRFHRVRKTAGKNCLRPLSSWVRIPLEVLSLRLDILKNLLNLEAALIPALKNRGAGMPETSSIIALAGKNHINN